jgi:hypothetical protein
LIFVEIACEENLSFLNGSKKKLVMEINQIDFSFVLSASVRKSSAFLADYVKPFDLRSPITGKPKNFHFLFNSKDFFVPPKSRSELKSDESGMRKGSFSDFIPDFCSLFLKRAGCHGSLLKVAFFML